MYDIHPLSLHDALPISCRPNSPNASSVPPLAMPSRLGWCCLRCLTLRGISIVAQPSVPGVTRSEEHTSELQSRRDLVCRLLLEKKNVTHHHHKARAACH